MENISKKDAIKGYKVFDDDWTCNDKFYKVGETSHEDKVWSIGNFPYYPIKQDIQAIDWEVYIEN